MQAGGATEGGYSAQSVYVLQQLGSAFLVGVGSRGFFGAAAAMGMFR